MIRTITLTILADLYRKTQIVGRDPWENQKGLPSDWRQNQKTGKTQQEKKVETQDTEVYSGTGLEGGADGALPDFRS